MLADFVTRVECPDCGAKIDVVCVYQVKKRDQGKFHVRRYQEARVLRNKERGVSRRGRKIVHEEDPLTSRSVSNYELMKAGCYRVAQEKEATEENQT
jgi:hypothetical protein